MSLFPTRDITKIKTLSLYRTNTTSIEKYALLGFHNLERLTISHSKLAFIDDLSTHLFGTSSNIVELNLQKNNISNISSDVFSNFEKLTTLNLAFNPFLNLETMKFPKALKNLKTLNLEYCNLDFLPDDIFENLM